MPVVVKELFALVFLDWEGFAWLAVEVIDLHFVSCWCALIFFEFTGDGDSAFLIKVVCELPGVVVDTIFVHNTLDLVRAIPELDKHEVFLCADPVYPPVKGDGATGAVVIQDVFYEYVFHAPRVREGLLNYQRVNKVYYGTVRGPFRGGLRGRPGRD